MFGYCYVKFATARRPNGASLRVELPIGNVCAVCAVCAGRHENRRYVTAGAGLVSGGVEFGYCLALVVAIGYVWVLLG